MAHKIQERTRLQIEAFWERTYMEALRSVGPEGAAKAADESVIEYMSRFVPASMRYVEEMAGIVERLEGRPLPAPEVD